ncbi:MAG: riboflavin kinase [Elusimicrobia bacterium]|nr:riboflavin kinase [Elusimicrobiota bacterium]
MKTLRGRVVKGQRVGRRLGFPTANVKVAPSARPPRGVWRVKVTGTTLGERLAVCNVGVRPTLGGARLVVEVHVPGWKGDLYGRTLKVTFLSSIRAEKKFPSLAALRAQIRRDVASLTGRGARGTMNA